MKYLRPKLKEYFMLSFRLLFLFLLVFLPVILFCQDQKAETDYHKNVRIEFFDKPYKTGRFAIISQDSVFFISTHTRKEERIGLENVKRINAKVGDQLGIGLLYGFGFGIGYFLVESFIGAVSDKYDFRDDAIPRYLRLAGITTTIGGLIGLATPIYKPVYSAQQPDKKSVIIKVTPYSDSHTNGLSLRIKF